MTEIKKDYLKIFLLFLNENICCDPHLYRLIKTALMRGYNVRFDRDTRKIVLELSILPNLICTGEKLSFS